MKVVIFCHSLVSDWNHGNAHFLRGICTELLARGHDVAVYEPRDGWSRRNLLAQVGPAAERIFRTAYPQLGSTAYDPDALDLDEVLDGASLVLVHEWNEPALVRRLGEARRAAGSRGFRLLFHDTHHRSVTDPAAMAAFDLSHYDGVLAFGEVIRSLYLDRGWAQRAWTWHEAADVRVFRPLVPPPTPAGDVVWVGNWGDDERTRELREFLIGPIADLHASARVYGVRYPAAARVTLAEAGIRFAGWLPNAHVPRVFAGFRATIHVPRRPYANALPGIPTIRVFEALACGIPLLSAPWEDTERLFTPGHDFLVATSGAEMRRLLHDVLHDAALAAALRDAGRRAVLARHTCAHRVDELLAIARQLGLRPSARAASQPAA